MGDANWLKRNVRYYTRQWRDHRENRERATGDRRLLFIRHPEAKFDYYQSYLNWLAETLPEVYRACDIRSLPFHPRDWSVYGVAMTWIFDSHVVPGRWEGPALRDLETQLAGQGIPVVNSLEASQRASKYQGPQAMARAGVRSPRVQRIPDIAEFQRNPGDFPFPLLIREEYGHAGRFPMLLIQDAAQLRAMELPPLDYPVAVEFVDVGDGQGYYRRYRYLAVGDFGRSFNLHIARHWEVRGEVRVPDDFVLREEWDFVSRPNPHHELFQRARRELGLGLVGFDYAYDRQGELIVFEANSLPGTGLRKNTKRFYQGDVNRAVFAALTRHLLTLAGRPVPDVLAPILQKFPDPRASGQAA